MNPLNRWVISEEHVPVGYIQDHKCETALSAI